jgi:hypothetical protein
MSYAIAMSMKCKRSSSFAGASYRVAFRRYTCRDAAQLLRDAGFRVLYASYWNIVLFPLMVIARKLLPSRGSASDVRAYSAPIEALGRAATALERLFLRTGRRFPFGGSLVAVAGKPAEN